MVKFGTDASGAIWWTTLWLMRVVPSDGKLFNSRKWFHLVAKRHSKEMWQCKWHETSHNDQILNRFVTNQKMQFWMKYKSDSKKYCKSEVQKYKNISNKQSLTASQREQILLTCVLILISSCSCSCISLTPCSGRLFSENNPIPYLMISWEEAIIMRRRLKSDPSFKP